MGSKRWGIPLKMAVARRGWSRRVGWVFSALTGLLLAPGCNSESFVPPPPPELSKPPETGLGRLSGKHAVPASSSSPSASSPTIARKAGIQRSRRVGSATIVEFLLAHPLDADRDYLVQVLRREAGKARIVFRLVQPEPGTAFSPLVMAKEVRAAVERGASGLIVDSDEDPLMNDALHEAVDQGMVLLLLDRPIAARGGKAIRCIRYGPFAESGREIVQSALDTVKLFHRPEPLRIVLLHHRSGDPYAAERLNALTEPLKTARKSFSLIEFNGDAIHAVESLQKSLAADPKLDLVFADDDAGMRATYQVLSEWTKSGRPEFLFAGYLAYDIRTSTNLIRQATVYGDQSVESFGLKTFQAIQSLLDEKSVGDVVDVPILIHRKAMVFVPTPADPAKTSSSSK